MEKDGNTQVPAPVAKPDKQNESRKSVRDILHLIMWILLVLLLLLPSAEIAAGEFSEFSFSGLPSLILLIDSILIFGSIALMHVRRSVKCEVLSHARL